jgi:hypothetical protein
MSGCRKAQDARQAAVQKISQWIGYQAQSRELRDCLEIGVV